MPISEAEQKDLDATKALVLQEKEHAWDMLKSYLEMSQEELGYSGHKTKEAACLSTMANSQKTVKKLWDAFLRKWPD